VGVTVYLPLLDTLAYGDIVVAQILIQAPTAVALPTATALFAEYFPTRFRYSASGLSFQLGGVYYGVILTLVQPAAYSVLGVLGSSSFIIGMTIALSLVSMEAVLKSGETKGEGMKG
jgi:hypothetical protein